MRGENTVIIVNNYVLLEGEDDYCISQRHSKEYDKISVTIREALEFCKHKINKESNQ